MYSSSRDHVLRDPEPDSNFLQMVITNFIFSYIYLLRTKNIYVEIRDYVKEYKILIFIYEFLYIFLYTNLLTSNRVNEDSKYF